MQSGGRQPLTLTKHLLRWPCLGNQSLHSECVSVPVPVLLPDIVRELKAVAPDRNIERRINALPDAFADPSLPRQVFGNLL